MKNQILIGLILVYAQFTFASVKVVSGEILVKFNESEGNHAHKLSLDYDLDLKDKFSLLSGEFAVYKTKNKASLKQYIELLSEDAAIDYVEPNFIYGFDNFLYEPVDPKFSLLWGLLNEGRNEPDSTGNRSGKRGVRGSDINVKNVWDKTKGSSDIIIAVIDTGVDYKHEDLKDNIWKNDLEINGIKGVDDDGNGFIDDYYGWDFANSDNDPMDDHGHGTHCSGTIAAAHNQIGVSGVMAEAKIMSLKFLKAQGGGSVEWAVKSIDYAIRNGADILSNSWGGGGHSQALEDILRVANSKGIIVTAAAGNSATNNDYKPQYPSNYNLPNIISVAATNAQDDLASFSCYGPKTVHVAAPGRNILSTNINNTYSVMSGTSMATPHVSGMIGLYLSFYGKQDPKFVRDELIATSVYKKNYGRQVMSQGLVDMENFLNGVYPEKPEHPREENWQPFDIERFESLHPYKNKSDFFRRVTIPGAKFVRAVIREFDTEDKYDFIRIENSKGKEIQKIHGKGKNLKTEFVEGDTIKIRFTSDLSQTKWGFIIDQLEYISK